MNLAPKVETFGGDDQTWLGSAHGTDHARSITLDKSAFTANTHYPNGYIRSGTAVAQITASKLYGPYDDTATDGRQTLAGFLLTPQAVAATDVDPIGALFEHGRVVESRLPIAIDAAGKADVAGRITFA